MDTEIISNTAYIRHSLSTPFIDFLSTIQDAMYRERIEVDRRLNTFKMHIQSAQNKRKNNEMLYGATPLRNQMVNKYSMQTEQHLRELQKFMRDKSYNDLVAVITVYPHHSADNFKYCMDVSRRTDKYLHSTQMNIEPFVIRSLKMYNQNNSIIRLEQGLVLDTTSTHDEIPLRNVEVITSPTFKINQISGEEKFLHVDLHMLVGDMTTFEIYGAYTELVNAIMVNCYKYNSAYGWVFNNGVMQKTIHL